MLEIIFDSQLDDEPIEFDPPPWVTIVAVLTLALTLLLAVFIYLGIWLAIIATITVATTVGLWLRVGYVRPISRRVLPAHILLIVVQLIHGAELLRGGYANTVTKAFPTFVQPANILTDASVALSISLCATVLWLLGGALAFYHARAGGFVVLLLVVWGMIFPVSHMLIPLLSPNPPAWVPGMVTGPVVALFSALSLRYILTHPFQRASS